MGTSDVLTQLCMAAVFPLSAFALYWLYQRSMNTGTSDTESGSEDKGRSVEKDSDFEDKGSNIEKNSGPEDNGRNIEKKEKQGESLAEEPVSEELDAEEWHRRYPGVTRWESDHPTKEEHEVECFDIDDTS